MTDATKTFADFGVDPSICEALADAGITNPFPIQQLTLPLALSRADVIGQARTGTGKTLAFGIPLLQAVDRNIPTTQALVIVPTRELCLQVHDDLQSAGSRSGITTAAVYGGKAIEAQTAALAKGVQVVVGTPGRLLDLRRRGTLELSGVNTLVLDEADEMLDMGFLPDVEQLVQACATERQTLLFSATMPSEVVALARRYMDKPTFMRADVEEPQIAPDTRQVFLACHRLDKPAVLARILRTPNRGLCVVFTRTKRMADVLVEELAAHGVDASAIHSNLRQEMREKTLDRFRKGKVDVLCATEVAARGLDISSVTHVVNYDCPDDEKMYLHRIGRTGRAGAGGVAVTMTLWNEQARLEMIKRALGIEEPTHEVFSTSPELDELFDLPAAAVREKVQPSARSTNRKPAKSAAPKVAERTGESTDPPKDQKDQKDQSEDAQADQRVDEGRSRTRRRSKERARPRHDEVAETAPEVAATAPEVAAETAEAAPEVAETAEITPSGEDGPETTRQRRRVRRRATPSGGEPQTAPATTARDTAADVEVPQEPPAAAPVAIDVAERTPDAKPRDHEADGDDEPTPRPGQNSRRGGRGRGGRQGAAASSADDQEPVDHADGANGQPRPAVVARGEGKPALNRPMTISHLP